MSSATLQQLESLDLLSPNEYWTHSKCFLNWNTLNTLTWRFVWKIFKKKSLSSFFKILFYFWTEGKGGGKRGRETSVCGCLLLAPHWGPRPQPRHVSWLGIEPAILWFAVRHSIHWATPARSVKDFYPNFFSFHTHFVIQTFWACCITVCYFLSNKNPHLIWHDSFGI